MNQLALDFNPRRLARSCDPSTSHEAARRVREFATGHSATILDCLRAHGALTVDEIAKHTPLLAHQINKRLPEMQRSGLVRPTGRTRSSASGRPEREWEAV